MCIRDRGYPAQRPSSNCAPSPATATSTTTGATTSPRNVTASTRPATPKTSSHRQREVPPEEPHPFHIVAWATKALDEVRREVWNAARKGGQKTVAKELKNARFALWKNPGEGAGLTFGEIAGVLPQREAGVLQLLRHRLLPALAGRVPHLTPDLVERLGRPATSGDDGRDPLGRIGADQRDLGEALHTEGG